MVLFSGCRKKEDPICTPNVALGEKSSLPIGVAINPDTLFSNASYKKIVDEQFNSITPENVFKWGLISPQQNHYDWSKTDLLVDYAIMHEKRIHGHTLIWHTQLPAWVENFQGSRSGWEEIFASHINTVVARYKGKIKSWDVVNEAFNDDGTLRNSIWLEHLGPTYIEEAFLLCAKADPECLLFYNDYLLEMNPTKRRSVLQYLSAMRDRGTRVDGIGLQMHISTDYPDMSQVAEAFKEISAMGFRIHLSEIDISINPFNKEQIENKERLLQRQADVLGAMLQHYRNVPSAQQHGLTFWGVNDSNSWIRTSFNREDYPLLFDDAFEPKPAYCKLKEFLK